ncbi:tetratricopeptide repeat protein [Fulvivirga ligni]|uniref:tetratricopeptide repeat protein n=1 Tax=Fulvivirga ligni TaxID=2904246 RepID=UPI001F236F4C|nr:tetratricopeptide repeat protein [Fulvivirga ligni]UII22874.1 tetratricopeptide repeat protein [Fulvivirga ligni]
MKKICLYISIVVFMSFLSCESEQEPNVVLPENTTELEALLDQDLSVASKILVNNRLYKINRVDNPELALGYLEDERLLAESIEDYDVAGKALFNQGLIHLNKGDYIKSLDKYLQAVNYFETLKDNYKIATTFNEIGLVLMQSGNYEYAIHFLDEARGHLDPANNLLRQRLVYNLAVCYYSKNTPDYIKSESLFDEALDNIKSLEEGQDYQRHAIYNELGAIKYSEQKYNEAISYYLKSLEFAEGEPENLARGYANIGEAYISLNEYGKSKEWMDKSLALESNLDDKQVVVSIYNIMAKNFLSQGKYKEGDEYLEQAMAIANKEIINAPLQETLELTRETYKSLRQSSSAVMVSKYEHVMEIDAKQDALKREFADNTNYKALQTALSLSIDLNNEIKAKQAEVEQRELVSNIALVLGVLLIIGAFLIYTYMNNYRKEKKSKDKLEDVFVKVGDILEGIPGVSSSGTA